MHVKNKMYEYIGDELVAKIEYLGKALRSAQTIINSLEEENERLSLLLSQISKESNDNYWEMTNLSKTIELVNPWYH